MCRHRHIVKLATYLEPAKEGTKTAKIITHFIKQVKRLYSSSRLVTLCLSRVRLPASEKFERGEIGEGLMGPYAVVGFLPASQLLVERGQLIGVGLHFVEFLIVSAVGALHMGVQFR